MTVETMYNDVADFIAKLNPSKLLELKAPNEAREHVWNLIDKAIILKAIIKATKSATFHDSMTILGTKCASTRRTPVSIAKRIMYFIVKVVYHVSK